MGSYSGQGQFGDPRTVEIKVPNPDVKCCFCGREQTNPAEWGDMLALDGVVTHHFCLLFSAMGEQNGRDDEGIHAFLPKDIKKEVNRGKRLMCKFCKRKNATIGCVQPKCPYSFHYPCGYENGCLHQFFGVFESFCPRHKPRQYIPPNTIPECPICFTDVDRDDAIWPPCCGKQLFHRGCLMHAAKSAGYFFKCPLCNSKKTIFLQAMKENGVFVPEQDAAWEREENAFREMTIRYSKCDAAVCDCPYGRDFVNKGDSMNWDLVRCYSCGSSATHMKCSDLPIHSWQCPGCKPIFKDTDAGLPIITDCCHTDTSADEVINTCTSTTTAEFIIVNSYSLADTHCAAEESSDDEIIIEKVIPARPVQRKAGPHPADTYRKEAKSSTSTNSVLEESTSHPLPSRVKHKPGPLSRKVPSTEVRQHSESESVPIRSRTSEEPLSHTASDAMSANPFTSDSSIQPISSGAEPVTEAVINAESNDTVSKRSGSETQVSPPAETQVSLPAETQVSLPAETHVSSPAETETSLPTETQGCPLSIETVELPGAVTKPEVTATKLKIGVLKHYPNRTMKSRTDRLLASITQHASAATSVPNGVSKQSASISDPSQSEKSASLPNTTSSESSMTSAVSKHSTNLPAPSPPEQASDPKLRYKIPKHSASRPVPTQSESSVSSSLPSSSTGGSTITSGTSKDLTNRAVRGRTEGSLENRNLQRSPPLPKVTFRDSTVSPRSKRQSVSAQKNKSEYRANSVPSTILRKNSRGLPRRSSSAYFREQEQTERVSRNYTEPDSQMNYTEPHRRRNYNEPNRQLNYTEPDIHPNYSEPDIYPNYSEPDIHVNYTETDRHMQDSYHTLPHRVSRHVRPTSNPYHHCDRDAVHYHEPNTNDSHFRTSSSHQQKPYPNPHAAVACHKNSTPYEEQDNIDINYYPHEQDFTEEDNYERTVTRGGPSSSLLRNSAASHPNMLPNPHAARVSQYSSFAPQTCPDSRCDQEIIPENFTRSDPWVNGKVLNVESRHFGVSLPPTYSNSSNSEFKMLPNPHAAAYKSNAYLQQQFQGEFNAKRRRRE